MYHLASSCKLTTFAYGFRLHSLVLITQQLVNYINTVCGMCKTICLNQTFCPPLAHVTGS